MSSFCDPNVFTSCSLEELELLYNESKLYNHFAEIPNTSVLYKYMEDFLAKSVYRSISVFYLQLTRAYIDKRPKVNTHTI